MPHNTLKGISDVYTPEGMSEFLGGRFDSCGSEYRSWFDSSIGERGVVPSQAVYREELPPKNLLPTQGRPRPIRDTGTRMMTI